MSLSKDLLFLILQFCNEEDLKRTAHMLEQETGLFFDMKYFKDLVLSGNWDEAERYLSGFIKLEDDKYSKKIYFEIRKQKFLEALDEHDCARALDILMKDLKVFAPSNEELYKEMTMLLTLDDFRKHESFTLFGDTLSARKHMMNELQNIIEENPIFHEKLKFPHINMSRLRRLVNQSLNWQHILCSHPQENPDIKTLFTDHQCPLPNHPFGESIEINPLPSRATSVSVSPFSSKEASDLSTVTQSIVSEEALDLSAQTNPDATVKGFMDFDNTSKTRSTGTLDKVASSITLSIQSDSSVFNIPDDLPKTVGRILNEESSPTSMDFHPVQHTFLLVGTSVGDVGLWEVASGEKLFSSKFSVWKIKTISMAFLATLLKDPRVSVNRIIWSPDGLLFGVAYSKHIVQLYSYHGGCNIRKQLEIDAHAGGVNDLAFSKPKEQLLVVTCGDDKLIQVWDVITGAKQYSFEGHGAPVYSICPRTMGIIHFLFSTSLNGEIKAWFYDDMGARVEYDAPRHCCTRMAYSSDGYRLFSCGTTKSGESVFVEWDEREGCVKRTYQGLCNCSSEVVQFDTCKNQFLAAGDDHLIKFWDIDHEELLTTIDAEGDLPATPFICFNKKGTLLAVLTNHNGIKILANDNGLRLLQISGYHSDDVSRVLSETLRKLAINPTPTVTSPGVTDGNVPWVGSPGKDGDAGNLEKPDDVSEEADDISEESDDVSEEESESDDVSEEESESDDVSEEESESDDVSEEESDDASEAEPDGVSEVPNFSEINVPSQCQSLNLPSELKTDKISKLVYTNAGNAILALSGNGIHLMWKWSQHQPNVSGKVTTKVPPQIWKPESGLLMTNDFTGINFEEVWPCFALSKNDYYVVSASGGRISLFDTMTFKMQQIMTTFKPPPPAATCIVFYPQDNNIIAIGMDDSTIMIYNIRVNVVIRKLKGHYKRVTSLAFSNVLKVLVSSGFDSQIIVWDFSRGEKKKSARLYDWLILRPSNTHVQFHQDQMHFLAVHENVIAIYEATELELVKQWVNGAFRARISHATFSCNCQLVCAGFLDGTVLIFGASNLDLRAQINPGAYLPSHVSSSDVYPSVIAAHPKEPNQFAFGLTNGEVVIVEPLESEGKWGLLQPVDDESYNEKQADDIPASYP
ncbi:topless-related protein 1-like isoform X2 [Cornus florida]|uniref:topless-related protein 1-like isoform X2 n=1 Tax=Cornus florida TaxID=4283 RepID=UPI00289F1339|nr:topless-related protein 1-like isoform X2 [Cornus florida]